MTHVLIVDDNADNLYLLRVLLQGNGFTVDEARNGAIGLARARERLPDVIVADLLMPVMDGYALLRQWKSDERLRSIPFVVYTATYTDPKDERLALDMGADAFLVKPAEPEPIMACLRDVLSRTGCAAPLIRSPQIDDNAQMDGYSKVLVHKLEQKVEQLEQTNQALRKEVAERKLTEAALRESEESHRRLLEVMPDAVFVNTDGLIAYCNPSFAQLLGVATCAELLGKPALSFFHPRYHDLIRERIAALKTTPGAVPLIEEELVRPDGVAVPVDVTATSIVHQNRSSTLVVLRDLRLRKELEDRFRMLIESVRDYAIYTMDANDQIATWNDGAARIFGYTAEEIIGQRRARLFSDADVAAGAPQRQCDRVLTMGRTAEEGWRVRKDGTTLWVSGVMTALRDRAGRLRGYVKVVRDMTEQKKSEETLRDSEERYRNLFHAIADPLFVFDRETLAYLAVNDAAVAKYGYRREELLSMTLKDIRPPEDVPALLERLPTLAADPGSHGVWRHRKKNGEVIDVEISTFTLEFAGRPACLVQARDVTAKRRAEADAARTAKLLQAVADGTPDVVFVKDRDGNYLLFNQAAVQFAGKPLAEVLGNDDSAFFGPSDAHKMMTSDRLVMEANQSQTFEDTLLTSAGLGVFQTMKSPYRDAQGNVIGVIGITRDVTQQRQAEASLRLRDRAIQAVSQGILITDPKQPDNPIIYASPGFERMTGYRSDEVLGRNCRFLQGKDTDAEVVRKLREAIAAGRECHVEILNYRKDGTPFWNALALNPVQDDKGALAFFVGVQIDVTERKKLEEQLRQSQKMEAVGRLAGGIAHDFNNLLTIISGYSEILLARREVDDTVRESVKAINEASERAAALTRQLLGFSRQTILQPKVIDLNKLIGETSKLLRRLIGEDVDFATMLEPNLDRIKVDPGQLDQILMNLAVNARDAMPQGGKLTVETANVFFSDDYAATHLDCKAGHHVMLAMSDTGCGMTPEITARIFEPFFTTKEVGHGTGLGLSVVFGIVQQSGGCIHVYSEVGHGTTFKIYFPAVRDELPRPSDATSSVRLGGTETILLVEDEDGVRGLALMSLQWQGYRVLTATDGHDALRVVNNHRGAIDLLLTDVVMPKLSGPELAAALQARMPNLRVLFMSGYTGDAVVRHGLLQAEVNFLQKPYTPIGLVRKVRQVLDERK